jgi:glutamine amidotransferase
MTIAVIDIGNANIGSLISALSHLGQSVRLIRNYREYGADIKKIVIPGVGSFSHSSKRLAETSLDRVIQDSASSGRPILGICLGMHLLAQLGREGGLSAGLGLIPGTVERLLQANVRLPHVGWNTVNFQKSHPVIMSIKDSVDYYFSHTYHFCESHPDDKLGVTSHGVQFTSVVAYKNILGVQFHPEKSQRNGLKLLKNFCNWNGIC